MKNSIRISILTLIVLSAGVACTEKKRTELHGQPNVELITDMMDQPALKPQDYDPYTGEAASRLPPDGTVPQGFKPYKYKGDPVGASAQKNPLPASPQSIALGKTKYETYCMVCHGVAGAGDGPVAPKMAAKPPALNAGNALGYSDGRLYHIITDGQGVMSSYAYQLVDENDRWAIVNYIRTLQKK